MSDRMRVISRGRSSWLVSILVMVVGGASPACSFRVANEAEIRMDAWAGVDVRLPSSGSGNTFQSDANVTCVMTSPMTSNLPPDILIVLDRSGSMQEDLTGKSCGDAGCGATSKWSIATSTLGAFLPTVEGAINWGLKLFSSGMNACDVSGTAEVAPRPSNAAVINQRLAATMPGSSTPTTAALKNAATYLQTLTDSNPKFILLATDGIPTCGAAACPAGVNVGDLPNQCDDANAIAMVRTIRDLGFPTFVLGIGTSSSPGQGTLTTMAINGGYPRNGTPSYYPIDKPQDLTDAFKAITGMVSSCFFTITPALTSGQQVTGVTAGGVTLGSADYLIVGNNGVQLVGQACADFMAGTTRDVAVQVSCNG